MHAEMEKFLDKYFRDGFSAGVDNDQLVQD